MRLHCCVHAWCHRQRFDSPFSWENRAPTSFAHSSVHAPLAPHPGSDETKLFPSIFSQRRWNLTQHQGVRMKNENQWRCPSSSSYLSLRLTNCGLSEWCSIKRTFIIVLIRVGGKQETFPSSKIKKTSLEDGHDSRTSVWELLMTKMSGKRFFWM